MSYDDLLQLVKQRRSIRRFKPDPIPDDYVQRIVELARWAPSGFNTQPWEFIVVKNKELKDTIVQLVNEYWVTSTRMEATREPDSGTPWRPELQGSNPQEMDYSTAPVFILLLGDTRTKKGLPMAARFDKNRSQLIYDSSLAGAFLYMHLAATVLGLASQWVSSVRVPLAHCLIKDILGIPEYLEVYDMMAVGYPAVRPRKKLVRAREEMLHYDHCGKDSFRSDEDVNSFIRRTRTWTMATIRRRPD